MHTFGDDSTTHRAGPGHEPVFGEKVRVYGQNGALTFEVSTTRSGAPTVTLDAAASAGESGYDWANKLSIQFTQRELPVIAAVMMGFLANCEYGSHGANKDKRFFFKHQGDKVFVRVWSAHGAVAVPVVMADAYYAAGLLILQLHRGMPWLNGQDISTLLRATIGRSQMVRP